jgi:hypothetical protein
MIQQNAYDLSFLGFFLQKMRFKAIIELGTGTGRLAEMFSLYSDTYSFDIEDRREEKNDLYKFYQLDIFSKPIELITALNIPGPIMIFCDNGNKPLEFKIFSKYLKRGSCILVHDYPFEITDKDIDPVVKENHLIELYTEKSKDSRIRAFLK